MNCTHKPENHLICACDWEKLQNAIKKVELLKPLLQSIKFNCICYLFDEKQPRCLTCQIKEVLEKTKGGR